jgi:hypothetical protein
MEATASSAAGPGGEASAVPLPSHLSPRLLAKRFALVEQEISLRHRLAASISAAGDAEAEAAGNSQRARTAQVRLASTMARIRDLKAALAAAPSSSSSSSHHLLVRAESQLSETTGASSSTSTTPRRSLGDVLAMRPASASALLPPREDRAFRSSSRGSSRGGGGGGGFITTSRSSRSGNSPRARALSDKLAASAIPGVAFTTPNSPSAAEQGPPAPGDASDSVLSSSATASRVASTATVDEATLIAAIAGLERSITDLKTAIATWDTYTAR